jgi:hypothetical protein
MNKEKDELSYQSNTTGENVKWAMIGSKGPAYFDVLSEW